MQVNIGNIEHKQMDDKWQQDTLNNKNVFLVFSCADILFLKRRPPWPSGKGRCISALLIIRSSHRCV